MCAWLNKWANEVMIFRCLDFFQEESMPILKTFLSADFSETQNWAWAIPYAPNVSFSFLNWKFISTLGLWWVSIEIWQKSFTTYQKRNFRIPVTNGNLVGISTEYQEDYCEEN